MKKIIVVADWASDSLTCQEYKSATQGFLKSEKGSDFYFVTSTPSTIHTSFLISQIVETEEYFGHPSETVIFQNTDPRLNSKNSIVDAEGALPIIIKLKSGIYLTGPNSGYSFSMIKDKIEVVFQYKKVTAHSQFHSRDLYSRISAHLMDYLEDEMDLEEKAKDIIPDLKGYYIGHIDNFGNIKTTILHSDFKGKYEYRDILKIKINKITKKVKYVSNLFGGVPGELVIYPGSSGKENNRYLEITIWRHFTEENITTGINEFNFPRIGSLIEILS